MILKKIEECNGHRVEKVYSDIKMYSLYEGTFECEYNNEKTDIIPVDDYQTEDYSLGDNPPTNKNEVISVFLMNDQGQTIERIK